MKRFVLEGTALVAAAAFCAVVANAIASNQKKVAWIGDYPHALEVPAVNAESVPTATTPAPPAPASSTITTGAASFSLPASTTTRNVSSTAGNLKPAAPQAQAQAKAPDKPVDLAKFQPHPDKPSVEIQYDEAAALHRAGALFLDARRSEVYQQGHIAGARPFSVWEADIDQKVNALFDERNDPRDQNKPIVIYCSGGACEDSHMLAQKLWGIQFNNVYIYKDGYPDWQKRRGATRQGTTP